MSDSSPLIPRANQYGRPSFFERASIFFKLLALPVVICWTFIFPWRGRSRKRSVFDSFIRYTATKFSIRQLQHFIGTTKDVYYAWCAQVKQEPYVEAIGESANLLWIGERKLDKVILYFHGGAFLFPPGEHYMKFWDRVRTALGEGNSNLNVSVALLEYTLVPVAAFPTPLKQAVTAINHILSLGVEPHNIQLVGDSAGANLILQVLSHFVHPLEYENVPPLSLPAPLKGACMISPWVDLSDKFGTLKDGDSTDIVTRSSLCYWGAHVLGPVPQVYRDYIEANSAREEWWKGVDAFVDRVLVTAGRGECLKSEIIRFKSVFEIFHSDVKLLEHEGVHDDPFYAVATGESGGGAPDMIIDWFRVGFQEA